MTGGTSDRGNRNADRATFLLNREASRLKRQIRDERDRDIEFVFGKEQQDPWDDIVLSELLKQSNSVMLIRLLMSDLNIESLPLGQLRYFLNDSGHLDDRIRPEKAREYLQLDPPPFEDETEEHDEGQVNDASAVGTADVGLDAPARQKPTRIPSAIFNEAWAEAQRDPLFEQKSVEVIWDELRRKYPQHHITREAVRSRLTGRKRGPKPRQP